MRVSGHICCRKHRRHTADKISVGVITQALENIAYPRAQNGGSASRLAFNAESLVQQKTNMRAALGRMVDVDFAEETTNMVKYRCFPRPQLPS